MKSPAEFGTQAVGNKIHPVWNLSSAAEVETGNPVPIATAEASYWVAETDAPSFCQLGQELMLHSAGVELS